MGDTGLFHEQVRELHARGLSQAQIKDQLGVTRWAVRRAASDLGLSWDVTRTAAATRAAAVHMQQERVELMARWHDLAGDALDAAESAEDGHPYVVDAAIATDKAVALARAINDLAIDESEQQARGALSELVMAIRESVD